MQRLLIAALLALLFSQQAFADSTVHGLATNTTSPLPASSCIYVDQGGTTDTKLCSGWAAALGGLVAASNLSDLTNAGTARTNLGLTSLATTTPGTGEAAAIAAAINSSTGLIGAITPTLNNCVVGNGSAWTSATCPGGGGSATGVGVDGGTSSATVTATGTVANGTRLEKIGTLTGAITRTLPAISAVSSDTAICFDDAAQNISGTNTLTIAANAADSINGGTAGGSVGPYSTASIGLCLRVSATHNWTVESGASINASSAGAGQIVTGVNLNGLTYGTQTAAQIAGSAANHAVPVDVGGTPTWKAIPDCQDSAGNHINYTQSTDAFSCGTSSSGGGGGAETLISNQAANNTATNIAWTGLGSTYKYYHLVCNALVGASTENFFIQVGESTGPTWETTNYDAYFNGLKMDGTQLLGHATAFGGVQPNGVSVSSTAANGGLNLDATIYDIQGTHNHSVTGTSTTSDGTNYAIANFGGTYVGDTGAVTAIRIITVAPDNIVSGNCSLSGHS